MVGNAGRRSTMHMKWSDATLIQAISVCKKWKDVCDRVGLSSKSQRNVYRLRKRALELGLNIAQFKWKKTYDRQDLQKAVKNSFSYRQVLLKLGLSCEGSAYPFIKKAIQICNFDTSHFLGRRINKNKKSHFEYKAEEILIKGSKLSSIQIKNFLFRKGLKKPICEMCGTEIWMGRPVPTELDHINGINDDSRFENLRIVCRNCGGQLLTFCRGSKGLREGAGTGIQAKLKP
jgi:hypothetical protein